MNERNNNDILSWLLLQVIHLVKHRLHGVAEEHGLTLMQLSAFMTLAPEQMVPMSALSHQLACDASSITGIVDRLEARDLVERRDKPADRRLKMVALTPAGAELQAKITAEIMALEEARLRPILSHDEQNDLKQLLKKILAASA
jgi:DNA-binding MarR family transcriptional regulator